ncbi:MAG: VWA domain-containing protein [Candidatus Pacearchaeota archaeon]
MYLYFSNPLYLNLLFVVPILIFFHFYSIRNMKGKALKFANFDAIARINGIDFYSKNVTVLIFNILIVFSLVFALSGLTLYKDMNVSSFSFVVAIDSSESMSATDIAPTRFEAAKETSINFVDSLPDSSRIGIISFSGNSFIEQEVTNNKQELKQSIQNIVLTNYGGTDLYEAVSTSLYMLRDEENKAIILLSDGQVNIGNLQDVIENARKNNIIIHTYVIGTSEGGKASFGISKTDEDSLKSIAYETGGKFFKIESKDQMTESFNEVAVLTRKLGPIDLSVYLIFLTILIFIVRQFFIDIVNISI